MSTIGTGLQRTRLYHSIEARTVLSVRLQWAALVLVVALCGWVVPTAAQESKVRVGRVTDSRAAGNLYAVLVGVGRYEHLLEKHQLEGPPNDVRFFRDYLMEAGFLGENVFALADGDEVAPTRANILAALQQLTARLQPDDFVLVYLAGHGSQQPDGSGDEADGRDEIFLPADTKNWENELGTVENAITDDELGGFVDGYRARGADVWVVIDSCSSGTMTRGLGDDLVRTRNVEPAELGIPPMLGGRPLENAERAADGFGDGTRGLADATAGALIQFFAARADEKTPEYPFETGREGGGEEVRGLFTQELVRLLYRYGGATYGDLAQGVLARYRSIPHTKSTPQFYGSNMNSRVFGGMAERNEGFWAAPEDGGSSLKTERAGTLRGFGEGARVAVYADPGDDAAIGTGEVSRATATEAWIVPEWEKEEAARTERWRTVYLRLVETAYDPTVRVSSVEMKSPADTEATRRILDRLEEEGGIPFVEFSHEDPDSDFFAAFFDEKFHLLKRGQTLPCEIQPPQKEGREDCERSPEKFFEWTPEDAGSLIRKAARARNLVRLQGAGALGGGLEFDVEVQRSARTGAALQEGKNYLSREEVDGVRRDGDVVVVSTKAEPRDSWDVSFFWVDSQFGITSLQRAGESVRIRGRERLERRPVARVGTDTTGEESLVIIAEPVRDGIQSNYHFLEQERHAAMATRATKEAEASPLRVLMEGLWAGSLVRTRSGGIPAQGFEASVGVFTWTVEELGGE